MISGLKCTYACREGSAYSFVFYIRTRRCTQLLIHTHWCTHTYGVHKHSESVGMIRAEVIEEQTYFQKK